MLVSRPGSGGGILILAESKTNTHDDSWKIYHDYRFRVIQNGASLTMTHDAWGYKSSELVLSKDNRGKMTEYQYTR